MDNDADLGTLGGLPAGVYAMDGLGPVALAGVAWSAVVYAYASPDIGPLYR